MVIIFVLLGMCWQVGITDCCTRRTVFILKVDAMNVQSNVEVEEVTAPKVPTIEQAYSKQSDSITVEFGAVPGASAYILRAESSAGELTEIPVSASPGTILHLQPYTNYILRVMSVNNGRMSRPSLPVEVRTVVAAPELNSSSSSNSTILLTWDQVEHAVLYTLCIIKEGSDTRVKLNTTDTFVAFTDLEPGTTYCIKANAWDPNSIPGEDFTVCQITRPPIPGLVQVMLTVDSSQEMAVHWEAMHGADHYLVDSTTGQNCTSSDTSCIISPLSCGQNHSITVFASNWAGLSAPSEPEDFLTFPCPPEMIWVEESEPGNCTLLWSEVPWVEYYKAFVKRDDGSEELCNTTSNTCNCHCLCGFTYFINVFAHNRAGSSLPGHVLNYTTIPCCPEDVSISLVSTETLEIAWSHVRGAEVYETKATSTSGLIYCNDTAPMCALSDLRCDTRYNVVVRPCCELRGCNNTCRSHTGETAPCKPEILGITPTNETLVNISWSASNRKANYTVTVVGEMDSHTCHSAGTSCEISHLKCGSAYKASAIASTSAGLSLPSYALPLETGPCCPHVLKVTQVTQALINVTWSETTGAQTYITSLTSSRGSIKCHTLETHCLMGCFSCGTNYSVSLEAISGTGHKSQCIYHGFSSSACCPSSVKLYRITKNTIRVRWRSSSSDPNSYTADLYGANSNYTCSPQPGSNSCQVSEIICGDVYTVVVAPVSQDGTKIKFCPKRMYSVSCSGSNVGIVVYRGKRSVH